MLRLRIMLLSILALLLAPAFVFAEDQLQAGATRSYAYFIQLGGLRDGQTTTWLATRLDPGNNESVFESGHNRIGVERNAGFFEWNYGLCGYVKLKNLPGTSDVPHGPALEAAIGHGKRYEIGDVEIGVYIPRADEFEVKLWRLDITDLSEAQIQQLCEAQEDRDGDGFKDPPGKQVGSLRWEIDCPDLGYLRDTEITAEVLRDMQFGLPNQNGGQ